MPTDRELGMDCAITRRDFLNGCALAIGALGLPGIPRIQTFDQDQPGYYPPALTGMRGSHPGSFETAHKLRDGKMAAGAYQREESIEDVDLVIVVGGLSGLAAAYFYQIRGRGSQRILILDNHDDFGGHAKRNEFYVDGHLLITYGGTMSIESPFPYSAHARALLDKLKIDPVRLTERVD